MDLTGLEPQRRMRHHRGNQTHRKRPKSSRAQKPRSGSPLVPLPKPINRVRQLRVPAASTTGVSSPPASPRAARPAAPAAPTLPAPTCAPPTPTRSPGRRACPGHARSAERPAPSPSTAGSRVGPGFALLEGSGYEVAEGLVVDVDVRDGRLQAVAIRSVEEEGGPELTQTVLRSIGSTREAIRAIADGLVVRLELDEKGRSTEFVRSRPNPAAISAHGRSGRLMSVTRVVEPCANQGGHP